MLVPNPSKNQKNVLKMEKQHLERYKTSQIFINKEAFERLRKEALRSYHRRAFCQLKTLNGRRAFSLKKPNSNPYL
jgi:hypothetical protein